jgi:hypothetical protein
MKPEIHIMAYVAVGITPMLAVEQQSAVVLG